MALPLSLRIKTSFQKTRYRDMRFIQASLFVLLFIGSHALGQDTLPRFTAVAKANGKIIISWHNNYPVVNQISIQRSSDSLRNFTTLITVPDPTIPENGVVDNKPVGNNMFYRLFVLLSNGKYLFTKSQKAFRESDPNQPSIPVQEEINLTRIDNQRISYLQNDPNKGNPKIMVPSKIHESPKLTVEKTYIIKARDTVISRIPLKMIRQFRDSILTKTKDTINFLEGDTILIKPFVVKEAKEVYKISAYVYTSKDGNVTIALPEAAKRKYEVKFLEQDASPLIDIKDIKDPLLIVDKTNFVHAGWFRFELYEDGKLKEKNKLFIPKDF